MSDKQIPIIDYTEQEKEVWSYCYNGLEKLFVTNACEEFNWSIQMFKKHLGLKAHNIPQLNDISEFLK